LQSLKAKFVILLSLILLFLNYMAILSDASNRGAEGNRTWEQSKFDEISKGTSNRR